MENSERTSDNKILSVLSKQEMGDFVRYQELLDLRKKELLHKRWTERVYQPIRRQVVSEANSPEFGELFQRKRQLYKEYLEHVNKKVPDNMHTKTRRLQFL